MPMTGGHIGTDAQARAYQAHAPVGPLFVLRPGFMEEPGALQWADLRPITWAVGPSEAVLGAFLLKTWNHRREITATSYAPESKSTSGNVPIWQNRKVKACLDIALRVRRWIPSTVRFCYAPGFTLLCKSYEWGESYLLDVDLIEALAAKLPPGSLWLARFKQLEFIYEEDSRGLRQAVGGYVNIVRGANPDLRIVLHGSAPSAAYFCWLIDALAPLGCSFYAGIHPEAPPDILHTILTYQP
jgi:hypothetical protein